MHALIIENEALIALTIEEVLRDCGFTSFDIAASTEQAIMLARQTCPDLITADVDLNPGSGIEAVNSICPGPRIPVIFVTGCTSEVAGKMPLFPCIGKPFRVEALITAVQSASGSNSCRSSTSRHHCHRACVAFWHYLEDGATI